MVLESDREHRQEETQLGLGFSVGWFSGFFRWSSNQSITQLQNSYSPLSYSRSRSRIALLASRSSVTLGAFAPAASSASTVAT
jgi:hypothetical protein